MNCHAHTNEVEAVNRAQIWRELNNVLDQGVGALLEGSNALDLRAEWNALTVSEGETSEKLAMGENYSGAIRQGKNQVWAEIETPIAVGDFAPFKLVTGEYGTPWSTSLVRSVGCIAAASNLTETRQRIEEIANDNADLLLHHTYPGSISGNAPQALTSASLVGLAITAQTLNLATIERLPLASPEQQARGIVDNGELELIARGIGSGIVSRLAMHGAYIPNLLKPDFVVSQSAHDFFKQTRQVSKARILHARQKEGANIITNFLTDEAKESAIREQHRLLSTTGTCPAKGVITKMGERILEVRASVIA